MFSSIKEFLTTNFLDMRFRTDYKHYVFQSFLIFVCISLILLLSKFFDGIIVASLGASSFILFVTPHANGSRIRYLIGGYICGSFSGLLFNLLYYNISGLNFAGVEYVLVIISAAAVALTTLLMVITNMEHPPAVAFALGLSFDAERFKSAAAAMVGVIILCVVRQVLKKHLKNLV